jgi:hypothetical protein
MPFIDILKSIPSKLSARRRRVCVQAKIVNLPERLQSWRRLRAAEPPVDAAFRGLDEKTGIQDLERSAGYVRTVAGQIVRGLAAHTSIAAALTCRGVGGLKLKFAGILHGNEGTDRIPRVNGQNLS